MSLRNLIQEIEYDVPHGLDTTTPIAAMKPGYVRRASNVNIGYSGGYTKRDGYVNKLSSVWTGKAITFGVEFKTSTGIDRQVIFGTDGTGAGGVIGYNNAGTVSVIQSGLVGTVRPVLTQFFDLLFFYNGPDTPLLYDGTNVRNVGIAAPGSAPTYTSQSGGGALTLLGSYVYAYTYYNSVTGAESSPSPFTVPLTLTGANNAIQLGVTAGDPTYADTIRLYRTFANQAGPLYLDQEAAIGSTALNSTVVDQGLGDQLEIDNSRIEDLTDSAKYATNIQNRVFLKSGSNELRWSKIGQNGPMPESFEIKATTRTIGRFGAADDIVGINRISQTPIVLKERSLGRLDQVGIPDNGQSSDNVIYEYKEISDAHSAVSHWAAAQVRNELLFLGKDNIYATDGVNVRSVADTVKATIKTLGFTSAQRERLSAINDVQNSRILFQVFSSPGATNPDMVLVGDYQLYPEFRWTFYDQNSNSTLYPSFQAGSFFQVVNASTGQFDVYMGNSTKNGKMYQINSGTNDDSKAIPMYLASRPYSGDSPLKDKLYKLSEIQVKGNGGSYDLTICAMFDLSVSEEECIPLSLDAGAFLYDAVNSIYDTATYSDESIIALDYHLHRRCKFVQIIFKQLDADAPIDLFGWGVASSAMGLNAK